MTSGDGLLGLAREAERRAVAELLAAGALTKSKIGELKQRGILRFVDE